jgi:D-xylose reductase
LIWNSKTNFSVQLAKENDIAVTAYSSFGPISFRELDWKKAHDAQLLFDADPVVSAAKKHGKTPAQVLLRWATQRGICVIPKSNDPARLSQNLDCCGFDLIEDEIQAISALDRGLRFNDPSDYTSIKLFA